ncbi:MAG: tetratricopeptide repeat protein, partial [Pirellulales bacterium]
MGAQTAKTAGDAATRQFAVAQALQAREHYDLAADEWTKFLKNHASDPRAGQAQYFLGVCRFKNKQYQEAIAAFLQVITAYPKSSQLSSAWLHLGLAQYNAAAGGQTDLYAKAAENLATVLKSFPQSKEVTQAAFYRGEALYALGDKAEAAKLYAEVVEKHAKDPLVPEALYALGVTQNELGQTAAAGASYDAYLKQFPGGRHAAEVTLRRGEILFLQTQFEAAEKWFAAAAGRSDFKEADVAAFRQATALYELRKYSEAAALYASIEQKFPQSKQVPAARLAAGKSAFMAGDLDRAREQLAKCLSIGGATGAEAAHWLARGYLEEQKPDEAVKVIDAALPSAGPTPLAAQLAMDRADALYEQPAKRREAAAAYADLAQKHPQDPLAPQALYMAALTLLNAGDHSKALESSEQFLKQFAGKEPAADVEYIAAESNLQLGEYDGAIARYDRLLTRFPKRSDVSTWQVRRGLALFLNKKYADVLAALE